MTIRALIVLLGILNLGVAAWWWFHTEPPSKPLPEPPPGVARLQLLQERRAPLAPAPAAPAVAMPEAIDSTPTATDRSNDTDTDAANTDTDADRSARADADATPPAQDICMRIGPFADSARLAVAQQALRGRILRQNARQTRIETPAEDGQAQAWRVWLPPAADRATANATAQRIAAAGFSDYFVITEGAEANAISLGRFSSEERAQQHASALRSAGFSVRTTAIGDNGKLTPPELRTEHWLDVVARAPFNAAAARSATGAAVRTTACAQRGQT